MCRIISFSQEWKHWTTTWVIEYSEIKQQMKLSLMIDFLYSLFMCVFTINKGCFFITSFYVLSDKTISMSFPQLSQYQFKLKMKLKISMTSLWHLHSFLTTTVTTKTIWSEENWHYIHLAFWYCKWARSNVTLWKLLALFQDFTQFHWISNLSQVF